MADARTVIHADLPGRRVVPPNDAGRDAILHVHGGGWATGSSRTHEGAARRLAVACACPVLTVDYALSPEAPFPAGLTDVLAAWAARDGARRWSVAGDSSGANLALAAMLSLIDAGNAGDLPASGLLFYGVYGAVFDTPSYQAWANGPGLTRAKMMRYWDWYAPVEARADPRMAPLAASDAALAALPPLYLNAAELDPLLSDTETLVARLRSLGRGDVYDRVPGVVHGFMQMGDVLPAARDAFRRAGMAHQEITAPRGQKAGRTA
jgi:acetyl esterase